MRMKEIEILVRLKKNQWADVALEIFHFGFHDWIIKKCITSRHNIVNLLVIHSK